MAEDKQAEQPKIEMYKTGMEGLDEILNNSVIPGSNILLIAPAVSSAKLLGIQMIYEASKKNIPSIYITFDEPPRNLKLKSIQINKSLAQLETNKLLYWIDGFSRAMDKKITSKGQTHIVAGPLALTDISVELSKIMAEIKKTNKMFLVVFDSLSSLLTYNPAEAVIRFVRVIAAKVKQAEGIALYHIDDQMHDVKVIETIRRMMDITLKIEKCKLGYTITAVSLPTFGEGSKKDIKVTRTGLQFSECGL